MSRSDFADRETIKYGFYAVMAAPVFAVALGLLCYLGNQNYQRQNSRNSNVTPQSISLQERGLQEKVNDINNENQRTR